MSDVAKLAGVSKVTVGMWSSKVKMDGKETLRWTLSPRGRRYYDPEDVREFLAKHPRYRKRVEPVQYVEKFTTTIASKVLNVKTETVARWARRAFPEKFKGQGRKSKWLLLTRAEITKLAELCDLVPDWIWTSPESILLSCKDAMQFLACTRRQLETWTANKPPEPQLKSEVSGVGKRIRYKKSDLAEFAREHKTLVPGAAENVKQCLAVDKLIGDGDADDRDVAGFVHGNHHVAKEEILAAENPQKAAEVPPVDPAAGATEGEL